MEKLEYIISKIENKDFAKTLKEYKSYDALYTVASDWQDELSGELLDEFFEGNNSSVIILYFIHEKKLLISHEAEGYQFDLYGRDYDGYLQVSGDLVRRQRMEFMAEAE